MRSVSDNEDEYTKMLIRQQLDERLKEFEDNMQSMIETAQQAAQVSSTPDQGALSEEVLEKLEEKCQALQTDIDTKILQLHTKMKILNMMVTAKRGSPDKRMDDDNYTQFSDSLRQKIEAHGDERSKNLLEKLLRQLAKGGGQNREEVIKQLEQLNQ